MEQSPLIEKEEIEIQKSAPEEALKSTPGEQELTQKETEGKEVESCEASAPEEAPIPGEQELTEKVSEEKEVESCEDSQVLGKELVQKFKKALVDTWLLVTPYLLSYRVIKPMAEDSVYFVEYAARKLDSFCSKYESIQDVKLLDVIEIVRSCAFEGLRFLQSEESGRIVSKYLAHFHMMMLGSLDYAAETMELVVPTVQGVKPLLELDAEERAIRKKSFYIIVNFFYRLLQKMVAYAEGLCGQLKKCLSPSWFLCGKVAAGEKVAVE